MISVLVAETHPLVRIGIRSALEQVPGYRIVGEAGDLDQLMTLATSVRADVVIIDLDLLGRMDGASLSALRATCPGARLLAFSDSHHIGSRIDLIDTNTFGYLSTYCSSAELRIAISTIAVGQPYISEQLAQALAQGFFQPSSAPHDLLTSKEIRVYKMLAIGIDTTGIAAQMGISPRSAVAIKSQILERMPVLNAGTLTRFALDRGFI